MLFIFLEIVNSTSYEKPKRNSRYMAYVKNQHFIYSFIYYTDSADLSLYQSASLKMIFSFLIHIHRLRYHSI